MIDTVHSQRTRNAYTRANVRTQITPTRTGASKRTVTLTLWRGKVTCDEVLGGARWGDVIKGVVR